MEDDITLPVRRRVSEWAAGAPEFSIKERIDFAINCGACASVYAGAAVLVADRLPGGQWLLRMLALSQAALIARAHVDKLESA